MHSKQVSRNDWMVFRALFLQNGKESEFNEAGFGADTFAMASFTGSIF